MRTITFILLFITCSCFSQDLKSEITLSERSMILENIVTHIQDQSTYYFSFDPQKIPTKEKVDFSETTITLETILQKVVNQLGIQYTIYGKNIVLKQKSESYSQKENSTFGPVLKGQVIDGSTRKAMPFATIKIKNTSTGTIANEEGLFDLKAQKEAEQTLIISFIGYKPKEVSFDAFDADRLIIELAEDIVNLKEVEVNPIEVEEVLSKTIEKIKDNYQTDPFSYKMYYRELVKVDTTFVKFADAATEVFNYGYTKPNGAIESPAYLYERGILPFPHGLVGGNPNKFQVKILEARASDNLQVVRNSFGIFDFEQFSLGNGIQNLLGTDYVMTPLQFLNQKNWPHYEFELEDYIKYNGKRVYDISFNPKGGGINKAMLSGRLYIDIQSYAVVGYEFEVPKKQQEKLEKKRGWIKFIANNVRKKNKDLSIKNFRRTMSDYNYKVSVRFQEFDGKWYLSHAKRIGYYHNYGDILDDIYFETTSELVVNAILPQPVEEIPQNQRFAGYLHHYPVEYHPEFWESYTSIVPTGVFGKALKDLQKNKSLNDQFKSRVTKDTTLRPPIAKKIPVAKVNHGTKRIDNYSWLQNRYDSSVQAHVRQENNYTNNYMIPLKKLSRDLYKEMVGRVKKNDESVPIKIDNYYYYVRFADSLNYPVYCRKYQSLNADEEIIQDVNESAENYEYYSMYPASPSPDHSIMPFYENLSGGFENTLRFKDLNTHLFLSDSLKDVTSMVWFETGSAILYTQQEEKSKRSFRVYLHQLGMQQENDLLIYEEKDPTFSVSLGKLKSKEYLFINTASNNENEIHLIDATHVSADKKVFLKRSQNHFYNLSHLHDTFYISSNFEAPNFQIFSATGIGQDRADWKLILPKRGQTLLTGFQVFNEYMVVEEKQSAQSYLTVIDLKSGESKRLNFGNHPHFVGLGGNPDPASPSFMFEYEDPLTPPIVYEYEFESGNRKIIKENKVEGYFNKKDYRVERVYATAQDGEEIPLTLIYKKGAKNPKYKVNGKKQLVKRKLYLTSYGAYGISSEPYFSFARLSLLNRNIIYAIAHVRGGRDKGEKWYQDGKMFNKKKTFSDFIDAAEHLVANDYIEKGRIAASGGSAGGLLVGAVVNERPDLFQSAILNVPFLDVVNTMLDKDLPLTTGEFKEWGNPEEKEVYDYIMSYAPYENIKPQAYPNMYFSCALNDDNVPYWEAMKMVAKLREYKTDENEILLRVLTSGGHGGGSKRFDGFFDLAEEYAFLIDLWKEK